MFKQPSNIQDIKNILTDPNFDYNSLSKEELEILLEIFKSERELQSSKNINLKIKINALYGAMANEYFRWKKHENAEAITSSGQLCVRGVGNYIETKTKNTENEISIVYYDTDSLFAKYSKQKFVDSVDVPKLDKIIDKNKSTLIPLINEYFDNLAINLNADKNHIKMDFELIADKTIFLAQKKYVMRKIYDDGKIFKPSDNMFKIRGVEIVRSSTNAFLKEKLKESLLIIFNENENVLTRYVDSVRKEFNELDFISLSNPTGVSDIEKHSLGAKSIPIYVRAALTYNEFIKAYDLTDKFDLIKNKDKIKYCYIKTPNIINSNIIGVPNNKIPKELEDYIKIDYNLQFQKNFINPVERFAKVINWNINKNTVTDIIEFTFN